MGAGFTDAASMVMVITAASVAAASTAVVASMAVAAEEAFTGAEAEVGGAVNLSFLLPVRCLDVFVQSIERLLE
jgi:hypothetical protein